jgi:hypothetical protein
MRLKTLSLIFLLVPAAALSQQKAVPVQLIEAKTVSVVCYGQPCPKPILSAAEKALRKWGRYSVADPGKDADLILSFWIGPAQYGPAHYEVLSPMGTGSTTDIATQHAPKVQTVTKDWTLSVLDEHQAAHPKLLEISGSYSEGDDYASYNLIDRLKKEVGKSRH